MGRSNISTEPRHPVILPGAISATSPSRDFNHDPGLYVATATACGETLGFPTHLLKRNTFCHLSGFGLGCCLCFGHHLQGFKWIQMMSQVGKWVITPPLQTIEPINRYSALYLENWYGILHISTMLGTWTRKRCPCLGIANGTGWTNVSTSFRRGVCGCQVMGKLQTHPNV